VHFVERSPEIIVLEDPHTDSKEVEETPSQQAILLSTVNSLLSGNCPDGYRSLPVQNIRRKIKKGFFLDSIARFEGENETLYLYQLHNTSLRQGMIEEKELQCPGGKVGLFRRPFSGLQAKDIRHHLCGAP
jgi:hypothetical protein